MKLTVVTIKQFTSLNLNYLLNSVQMDTKDLSRTAIVIRIKLQNTVEKQIENLVGLRISFLIGKVR